MCAVFEVSNQLKLQWKAIWKIEIYRKLKHASRNEGPIESCLNWNSTVFRLILSLGMPFAAALDKPINSIFFRSFIRIVTSTQCLEIKMLRSFYSSEAKCKCGQEMQKRSYAKLSSREQENSGNKKQPTRWLNEPLQLSTGIHRSDVQNKRRVGSGSDCQQNLHASSQFISHSNFMYGNLCAI